MSMTKAELSRLEKIEQFVRKLTLGSYLAKAANENGRIIGDRRLLENGEQTLAKAAGAYHDPDALMALGERAITDPTQMGIFSSHVAGGDLNAARDMLIDTKERGRVAKAADAAQDVENLLNDRDLDGYDTKAAISKLSARFGALEKNLTYRLELLEQRPQAAAPAPLQTDSTIAKAAGKKRRLTPEEDVQALMDDLERYVDDPATVGARSSMIRPPAKVI